jgi:hypothetical protein
VIWKKAPDAAKAWCGGINPKVLYAAVKAGKLEAARIGAGRNLLFCEQDCDAWLLASKDHAYTKAPRAGQARGASTQHGEGFDAQSSTTPH